MSNHVEPLGRENDLWQDLFYRGLHACLHRHRFVRESTQLQPNVPRNPHCLNQ